MNRHAPWRTLYLFALSRQIIESFAMPLEGRVHGWNLFDLTAKSNQHFLDAVIGKFAHRATLQHFALSITGGRHHAELGLNSVTLVGVQEIGRNLGCFSHTNGQQSGSERIETAGMAGLARTE